jgi:hypothetical protein
MILSGKQSDGFSLRGSFWLQENSQWQVLKTHINVCFIEYIYLYKIIKIYAAL